MSYILRLPNFIRLASCSILTVGSDPIERKQMSGVFVSLSDHVSWRSNITPSAYRRPNDSSTYFRAWDKVRSGAHDLQSRVRNEGLKKSSDISCTIVLYDGESLQFLLIKTNAGHKHTSQEVQRVSFKIYRWKRFLWHCNYLFILLKANWYDINFWILQGISLHLCSHWCDWIWSLTFQWINYAVLLKGSSISPYLINNSLRKVSNDAWYPSGISDSSGVSLSNHVFHCFSLRPIYTNEWKCSKNKNKIQ